jgi:phosphatidate phosphatase APP1
MNELYQLWFSQNCQFHYVSGSPWQLYPTRKYICVGDSGELDPEIYSKLFVIYPQNIAHIFIRDICGVGAECLSTCQERWTVFKDPKDVQTNIQELITI